MPSYIKSIHAPNIYGRYNFDIQFNRGINIIYGKNGTGKTTLIHILANALEGNFASFRHLDFDEITLEFDDEAKLLIYHEKDKLKVDLEQGSIREILYPSEEIIELSSIDNLFSSMDYLPPSARSRVNELRFLRNKLMGINDEYEITNIHDRIVEILRYLKERYPFLEDDILRRAPIINVSYFPAFREMIEAWASISEEEIERHFQRDIPTPSKLARDWFGRFTPDINYRSIQMIYDEISSELRKYEKEVWAKERELISNAFLEIFNSLASPEPVKESFTEIYHKIVTISEQYEPLPFSNVSKVSDEIFKGIKFLQNSIREEDETVRINLNIFYEFLKESLTTQTENYRPIKNYLDSVNKFFSPKKELVVDIETPTSSYEIGLKYQGSNEINNLRTLSSGERQILTMVYSATHLSDEKVVLIDEPEISLHVDWQRVLLSRMTEHIGTDKQIIACTHSPTIGADYIDNMIDLSKSNTK